MKAKVRLAKFALRGVGFSCSLIILAMVGSSFAIFRSTKGLSAQNGLPAWASGTQVWPQIVTLVAACISLFACILIFVGYCRGGHHRAEKVGVYYTLFAVGWFIFSMLMWAGTAGVLQFTKSNSGNQDMWGWACVDNHRADLFADKVDYALVCRLQVSLYHFSMTPSILQRTNYSSNTELGSDLHHHRSRHRRHQHCSLQHCLLEILLQAEADKVHGPP